MIGACNSERDHNKYSLSLYIFPLCSVLQFVVNVFIVQYVEPEQVFLAASQGFIVQYKKGKRGAIYAEQICVTHSKITFTKLNVHCDKSICQT